MNDDSVQDGATSFRKNKVISMVWGGIMMKNLYKCMSLRRDQLLWQTETGDETQTKFSKNIISNFTEQF